MILIKQIKTDTLMYTYDTEKEQEAHIAAMRQQGYRVDYDWTYYNRKSINVVIYEKAEINQG